MNWHTPLDRLRRPEYTGQNRCWPCTLVNLLLVVLASVALGFVNVIAGASVVVVGLVLIGLRGYVVPGTPRFAPTLVAPLPFDFGHKDERLDTLSGSGNETDDDTEAISSEAVLGTLVELGIVVDDGEQLYLDDEVRESWDDRMSTLRTADDTEFLDRVVAACPADVEGHLYEDRVLLAGNPDVRTSRTIAIAETAAIEVLAEWDVPAEIRPLAARPLRNFLQTCPSCGGPVRESTRQHCCGGPGSVYADPEQPVLACEDCESVVVEL